nr:metal ABC transporter permease [Crateriforma spongiae]
MIRDMIEPLNTLTWELDGWIIVAGVLCAVSCALLGNFLVLRRMSLLGDAVTHAVLPGLAVAFFISDSRSSVPMFLGAVIVGVLTALFTEWIRRAGSVDEGASMGVVFTSLFALGLILVVQAADHVDLDPGCVLYGAIELTPLDRLDTVFGSIPRAVVVLAVVMLVNLAFLLFFYKELKVSSFDPGLSTTMGFSSTLIHYVLMVLVAVTAVASFESVGNILVVAMFVVPPAAAFLLTDRLGRMIAISTVLAIISAVSGHIGAIAVPAGFGYRSTSTAGMMAVSAGVLLAAAALFGPRHGILVRLVRRRLLALRILCDDVCAYLFRLGERQTVDAAGAGELAANLLTGKLPLHLATTILRINGQVSRDGDSFRLTDSGRSRAQQLVRSHRLWEQYLVERAGLDQERIHDKAERLEHFTDLELRSRLDDETDRPTLDPHGAEIPDERVEAEDRGEEPAEAESQNRNDRTSDDRMRSNE